MKRIREEIAQAEQIGSSFTLLLLDIDHFKKVNDSFGHSSGDAVLKQTAQLMRENLRTQDLLGRWGGEEFLILLSRTDLQGARIFSEKVRLAVEKNTMICEGHDINITISIGGALYHPDSNMDRNLEMADKALYRSKDNGRNRVEFYED
jgi:diguanylate cyclase (GGDEF)-like protein